MAGILFYSFYTPDDYYKNKAEQLAKQLESLGLEFQIDEITIPEGQDWSDVCRKKIARLYEVIKQNPAKKVFWIDVDCNVTSLPDYVKDFSSDIVGFCRGFSSPLKIGYHVRSRFWEPCFIGFNCTQNAFKFIEYAAQLEKRFIGKATDDYFFEESWRHNCNMLSFQVIPSLERDNGAGGGFFQFGSSGNVKKFAGKVVQHEKLFKDQNEEFKEAIKAFLKKVHLFTVAKSLNDIRLRLSSFYFRRFGLLNKHTYQRLIEECIEQNDIEKLRRLKQRSISFSQKEKNSLDRVAQVLYEYQNFNSSKDAIPVCWYPSPAPGNYGDWLSPYIVSKISGRSVRFVSCKKIKQFQKKHLLFIGSIIKFATEFSVVFGTGASTRRTNVNQDACYIGVRGPITADLVREKAKNIQALYTADPAIVLPLLYPSSRGNNGRLALVRHFSHLSIPLQLPENMDELSIFRSSPKEIENFIDNLNQYSGVVTSAMHCFITCQAYGIPCCLVTWDGEGNKVSGDGMKYEDYSLGVGLGVIQPKQISCDLKSIDFSQYLTSDRVPSDKIAETYRRIKEVLLTF